MGVIHMVPFTVRERDQQIWLCDSDAPPFERGELLTYYLNMDMSKLKKWSDDLVYASSFLLVNPKNLGKYAKHTEAVFRLQKKIISFLREQPVYAQLKKKYIWEGIPEDKFADVQNELHGIYSQYEELLRGYDEPIEDEEDDGSPQPADPDPSPYFEMSEAIFEPKYQFKNHDRLYAFNDAIRANTAKFESMLDDLLRVKEVYLPFLKDYQAGDKEAALKKLFSRDLFIKDRYQLNAGAQIKAIYTLGEDGKIYRETEYGSLGSFLYTELMTCLQENRVPRCCANCGRFFMPRGGYDVEYCDNPAPGETDKTCKEVGARNTFARRVKDSPALQVFQRAYKTHHARIRSGHMTKESFAIWSARAMDLRDACLDGKITLEELEAELTKDLMYKKG